MTAPPDCVVAMSLQRMTTFGKRAAHVHRERLGGVLEVEDRLGELVELQVREDLQRAREGVRARRRRR